jgi:hypothetical protein
MREEIPKQGGQLRAVGVAQGGEQLVLSSGGSTVEASKRSTPGGGDSDAVASMVILTSGDLPQDLR